MQTDFFFQTIQNLRQNEELMLMENLLILPQKEMQAVARFLEEEYRKEALNFPYTAPEFNEAAAIWGAKTVYFAAQLLLYRENKIEDLEALFPKYENDINAGAILSADLCLRFIPAILIELRLIDIEDPLIEQLELILTSWHYSAIAYKQTIGELDFEIIVLNPCLLQLYADRVIKYKRLKLAQHGAMQAMIQANLGAHKTAFWSEYNIPINNE